MPLDAHNKIFAHSYVGLWAAQSALGIEVVESAIEHYGVEGITDNDRELEGDSRPVLQSLSISLTDQCKSQLVTQVPSSWSSENYGVEHYLKAVEIIKRCAPSISDLAPEQQRYVFFLLSV